MTTERLSFRLGVSIPLSSVKSVARTRYFLIASAWDTALLASATAASISAVTSGSSASWATGVPAGLPLLSSQPGSARAKARSLCIKY